MSLSSDLKKLIREEEKERGIHIFSNRHRREIFRELTKAPCQTSSTLSRKLGYDVQSVEWHLKKLRNMGFVNFKIYKKRLFYPVNLVMEQDIPLFYLLNTKSGWLVTRALFEKCREMPYFYRYISRASAYRVVEKLKNMNLLVEMKGSRKLVCLKREFYEKVDMYGAYGSEFKRDFLKRVEFGSYTAEVIGTHDYEVIIRISGMENFTLGIFISPLKTILGVKK